MGAHWGGVWLAAAVALAACAPRPAEKVPVSASPEPPQAPPAAAALGPVRVIEAEACARPPDNGAILAGAVTPEANNFYYFTNRTEARAIAKIRTAGDGRLVAAAYVAPGQSASVGPLPDGSYRASFAMGRFLAADCRSLDYASGYSQTAQPQVFRNRLVNGEWAGHTETYVLTEADLDGGQGARALEADKFNAP